MSTEKINGLYTDDDMALLRTVDRNRLAAADGERFAFVRHDGDLLVSPSAIWPGANDRGYYGYGAVREVRAALDA